MHDQCDVRPTVIFPLNYTDYDEVTETHVHGQLTEGCNMKVERLGVESVTC